MQYKYKPINPGISRFALVFVMVLSASQYAAAWMMDWAVRPFECADISRWDDGIYLVEAAGKKGLIKPDGSVIAPVEFDEITSSTGGYSLAIINREGRRQIKGTIDKDRYLPYDQTYYVYDHGFFNDGLMAVTDARGHLGYIDIYGRQRIGFDTDYKYIMPFTEGYAVVVYGDNKYDLIDTEGMGQRKYMTFDFVAEIHGISNVYDGVAYVNERKTGKVYEFDMATHKMTKSRVPQKSFAKLDYLFCPEGVTHRADVPPVDAVSMPMNTINPIVDNGLYGYRIDDDTVLPCQFDYGGPIEDGFAVVEINGRRGILRCRDIDFKNEVHSASEIFDCKAGESTTVAIDISGAAAGNQALELSLVDMASGRDIALAKSAERQGRYCFEYSPTDSVCDFKADVFVDNLLVGTDTLSLNFNIIRPVPELDITVSIPTDRANAADKIPVTAIIHNPNDQDVATNVDMTGGPKDFKAKSEYVEIPAKGTIEIKSEFTITEKISNASVTVSAGKHGSVTVKRSVLYPFY